MAGTKSKPKPTIEQLNLLTQEAIERASAPVLAQAAPTPAAAVEVAPTLYADVITRDRGTFGAWLITQHIHRREWIAGLAKAAKADHRFPKRGSVDDVRKYLTGQGRRW